MIRKIVSPNNSLKNEIEELVTLCKQLEDENTFLFNDGIEEETISDWEKNNGIKLPETYKDWLRFSNGAIVKGTLARLYKLEQIMFNSGEVSEDFIVIGEMIGDGTRLCFEKNTGEFVVLYHTRQRKYANFGMIINKIMDMM